ncbi:hypothetical protein [Bizionia paragorgiae]|uniref:Uncharacterized protein n=1 Tax=Bizionia paragorgiae TaxID=283786 RepID=A0A1H3VCP2_BIZPA|nr:hypothetical protein [Bizionia paragorgiae]MDX1270837.1 hypothetical protein [Bizionia paragorgiae]SDZ72585.1 hypothetical protein SAMN04487990_10117 [Bizionia paragorgiae]
MPIQAQHQIPEVIAQEVSTALTYFPQLKNTPIEFKFKKNIKKSTMQAQPTFGSLLKSKKNRSYVILISETVKISDTTFLTKDIPSPVLTGWIGHELGHIMDYRSRSNLNLIWFGFKYLFFDTHIIDAERAADTFAVQAGMSDYILKTKDFILNHSDIDADYKKRIVKYYLSPEEIMHLLEKKSKNDKDGIIKVTL